MAEVAIRVNKTAGSQPIEPKVKTFTFSFVLGIFVLVQILLIFCLGTLGYLSLRDTSRQLEHNFSAKGRELTLALAASSSTGFEKPNFEKLSGYFAGIVSKFQYSGNERPISEVFILEKSGLMLAHSDLAQITTNRKEAINEISEKYNNEFYHSALSYEDTSVLQQNLPQPTGIFRDKSSYIVDVLLPDEVHYSVDFAVSLKAKIGKEKKEKAVATLHVIMNRLQEYYFLKALLNKFIIIVIASMALGALITAILLFAFALRARYIQNQWRRTVQYRWENELMRNEMKNNLSNLSGKVEALEKKAAIIPPPAVVRHGEVLDAILVE